LDRVLFDFPNNDNYVSMIYFDKSVGFVHKPAAAFSGYIWYFPTTSLSILYPVASIFLSLCREVD
jgi:hypothetical protein